MNETTLNEDKMLTQMMSDIIQDERCESIYGDYLEDSGKDSSFWRRPWGAALTELTEEQTSFIPTWRDYWIKLGRRTTKEWPNKQEIKETIKDVYSSSTTLTEPQILIYLDSPLQGAIAAHLLSQVGDQVLDQVREQVWGQVLTQVEAQVGAQVRDQVWDQVGTQVRDQVWDQVRAQVREQVWVQVREQVSDQVGEQVGAQVRDQVLDQVKTQVRTQVRDQVYQCRYGLHDSGWLSFYSYLLTVGNLECCKRLLPLIRLAHLVGWWWPFEKAVIVTPPPSSLTWKGKKLISFEYPDGFSWSGK